MPAAMHQNDVSRYGDDDLKVKYLIDWPGMVDFNVLSPCSSRLMTSSIFLALVTVILRLVYNQFLTEPSDLPMFRASHLKDLPCFFNFARTSALN